MWTTWGHSTGNERATFQPWFVALCDALGATPPGPATDDHRFELPVRVVDREGREATNYIDAWRAGHFAIEAKAFAEGQHADAGLRRAYGQLRNYVAHVSGDAPPASSAIVPYCSRVGDGTRTRGCVVTSALLKQGD